MRNQTQRIALPSRGHFIAVEGLDGVGKSTQVQKLGDLLSELGHQTVVTREPGGTLLGEAVRDLMTSEKNVSLRAEALLMSAARAQHCEELIEPALACGTTVIVDRFVGSFLAYQGYGRGMDIASLRTLIDFSTNGLLPDMTILLESPTLRPPKTLRHDDRFEALGSQFQESVRSGYALLAKQDSWVRVSGDGDEEQVAQRILENVLKLFAFESVEINDN